jgi:hypothetical protein
MRGVLNRRLAAGSGSTVKSSASAVKCVNMARQSFLGFLNRKIILNWRRNRLEPSLLLMSRLVTDAVDLPDG